MKTLKIMFSVILMVVFSVLFMGADVYDNVITVVESDYDVTVRGTITYVTANATDTQYTKAIYIGDCNYFNSFMYAWTNAESGDDVNIFVEYSDYRETWKLGTVASGAIFDDLNGGTVQADTINVVVGVADPLFHGARWMRFTFDGQSGNPDGAVVTWGAHFLKSYKMNRLSSGRRIKARIS